MASENEVFWADISAIKLSTGTVDDLAKRVGGVLRPLVASGVLAQNAAGTTDGIVRPVTQKMQELYKIQKIVNLLITVLGEKGDGLRALSQFLESMVDDAEKAAGHGGRK
ncbi:hypothetical protein [Saccharopolyspora hattusasensis]|uniref:hypothetical protein n=1 Tax=Saccharopolyspora hattusasensis TaxID=1128679 RepID=UPI003D970B8F